MRVGFIGTGYIATQHLLRLARQDDVEIVAVCDINDSQIEHTIASVHQQTGPGRLKPRRYRDPAVMMRTASLDAVFVCVPPYAHGAPEQAALDAGVPMLVEKPVALDLGLAQSIAAAGVERGLVMASGYQGRYSDELARARDRLAAEQIALALAIRVGRMPTSQWFRTQSQSGGQVVEMATHQVDALRYLVGEVRSVYASGAIRSTNVDHDILDVGVGALTFADGAVGSLITNLVSGNRKPPTARGIHVMCEDLSVSVYGQIDEAQTFEYVASDGVAFFREEADLMAKQDAAFLQAARSGDPSMIRSDYLNGVRTLAVCLAHELSARSGRPVDVARLLAEGAPRSLAAVL